VKLTGEKTGRGVGVDGEGVVRRLSEAEGGGGGEFDREGSEGREPDLLAESSSTQSSNAAALPDTILLLTLALIRPPPSHSGTPDHAVGRDSDFFSLHPSLDL